MLNRDFDHLSTLLHLFFEREDICQKLNIIDQNNITGWEVWFQVEFAQQTMNGGVNKHFPVICAKNLSARHYAQISYYVKKAGHKIAISRLK
ncbi:hypothetical protein EC5905_0134 [Escherichia coli 5905]|nr:hypothetical protein ECO5905_15238 [Escherichia coli O55:H7 str. USDA 5905]EKI02794.1 hypothetical protein EC5905_0134 [Escherichia coli 5905]PIS77317.1 hypothetical protein L241_01050 [Escherichia coli O55:H7 str. USDA 5905]